MSEPEVAIAEDEVVDEADEEDEEYVWPESSFVVKLDTFLFLHFCFLITGVNKSSVDRLVCLVKFTDEAVITVELDDDATLKNSGIFDEFSASFC